MLETKGLRNFSSSLPIESHLLIQLVMPVSQQYKRSPSARLAFNYGDLNARVRRNELSKRRRYSHDEYHS